MNDFNERIKCERERLGFTQEDFAALAGKKRTAQQGYERSGGTKPDLSYLEAIHKVGADILYITTGQKGGSVSSVNEDAQQYESRRSQLSPIAELVDMFEKSSEEMQQAVLRMLGKE